MENCRHTPYPSAVLQNILTKMSVVDPIRASAKESILNKVNFQLNSERYVGLGKGHKLSEYC